MTPNRLCLLPRPLLTNPFLLAGVGLLLVAWFGYRQLEPAIIEIPVVVPGSELIGEGEAFGSRQGGSYLILETETGRARLTETNTWSDSQVAIPAPDSSGTVQVVKRVAFFDWPTDAVPFFRQLSLRLGARDGRPHL